MGGEKTSLKYSYSDKRLKHSIYLLIIIVWLQLPNENYSILRYIKYFEAIDNIIFVYNPFYYCGHYLFSLEYNFQWESFYCPSFLALGVIIMK